MITVQHAMFMSGLRNEAAAPGYAMINLREWLPTQLIICLAILRERQDACAAHCNRAGCLKPSVATVILLEGSTHDDTPLVPCNRLRLRQHCLRCGSYSLVPGRGLKRRPTAEADFERNHHLCWSVSDDLVSITRWREPPRTVHI